MKKRLLLVLAVGLSFAPPVFADGGHTVSDTDNKSIYCEAMGAGKENYSSSSLKTKPSSDQRSKGDRSADAAI